jgi:hypothetical protein
MTGNTDMHLLVTVAFKNKKGAWIRKTAISGVTSICLMQNDTSPSRRVDCGLWNVVPLLFNGCVKFLDIGGNWNMLSYLLIQSTPNKLNG